MTDNETTINWDELAESDRQERLVEAPRYHPDTEYWMEQPNNGDQTLEPSTRSSEQAPMLLNFDYATTSSEVLETQDNFFRNDALLQWEEEAKEHEVPINPADAFTQSWETTRPAAPLELAVAALNKEQENPQAPGAFGDTTKSTRRSFFGLTCGNSPDDSPEETEA